MMKLYNLSVTLPSSIGKKVVMKKYMTPDEIEEYRKHVTGIFELYGFAGAMISFTTGDDRSDMDAVPEKKEEVPVVPEPPVEVEKLSQYRKFITTTQFFKK